MKDTKFGLTLLFASVLVLAFCTLHHSAEAFTLNCNDSTQITIEDIHDMSGDKPNKKCEVINE